MAPSFKPEALVLGLALVALGVVWTLANFGRLDLLTTLRTWWPLALVVWGGLELLAFGVQRTRSAGAGTTEATTRAEEE